MSSLVFALPSELALWVLELLRPWAEDRLRRRLFVLLLLVSGCPASFASALESGSGPAESDWF